MAIFSRSGVPLEALSHHNLEVRQRTHPSRGLRDREASDLRRRAFEGFAVLVPIVLGLVAAASAAAQETGARLGEPAGPDETPTNDVDPGLRVPEGYGYQSPSILERPSDSTSPATPETGSSDRAQSDEAPGVRAPDPRSPYLEPIYPAPPIFREPTVVEPTLTRARRSPPPANTVTANPLLALVGRVGFQYERALGEYVSLFAGPSLLLYDGLADSPRDQRSYGLDAGARFFLTGHAPSGFWMGPQLEAFWVSAQNHPGEEESGAGWAASALGGYTWVLGDVFILSLGIGLEYREVPPEAAGDRIGYTGFGMVARASAGFAF